MNPEVGILTAPMGPAVIPSQSERVGEQPNWDRLNRAVRQLKVARVRIRMTSNLLEAIRALDRAAARLRELKLIRLRQGIVHHRQKRIGQPSGRRRRGAHHGPAARATVCGSASGDDGGGGSDAFVVSAEQTRSTPRPASRRAAGGSTSLPSLRVPLRHPTSQVARWCGHHDSARVAQ